MIAVAPIAVVAGDAPVARTAAGAVVSLLTAVGRAVDDAGPGTDLARCAAVVATGADAWRRVRARYAGPVLVVDTDLLTGAPDEAFRGRLDGAVSATLDLGGIAAPIARALPRLTGRALGDAPPHLACAFDATTGYCVPAVLTPAIRTARGFWRLAALLEHAVAALVGAPRVTYVEPWPEGCRAARALTCDLDDLRSASALAPLAETRRPATLFACADMLDRLGDLPPDSELAAHGDVHRSFADRETNLARVDRMLDAFRAAGRTPRGFSPPNLVYTSPLPPLFERFAYLRLGFQERGLRFFPDVDAAGGVTIGVSYYTDFLQRYVGADEYRRLIGRFCDWAARTGVLAVPCVHPCVWPGSLDACLASHPPADVWDATLEEVAVWWRRRRAVIASLAAGTPVDAPDVVTVEATPAERLAALEPDAERTRRPTRPRPPHRVRIAGHDYDVVPAGDEPTGSTDVPLGASWQPLDWLPRTLRGLAGRALLQVANRSGLHACFYDDLGLAPEIVHGKLRLPLTAPGEPIIVRHAAVGDLRRLARRTLGGGPSDA